jgi:TonB family protein
MPRQPREPRIDPRSPVQPGRSPAPYFVLALLGAILVWGAQQYWISDSGQRASRHDSSVQRAQDRSGAATESTGDVRTVFSADDYPVAAQQKGEEGTVQAQLTVDATGRVTSCTVIRTSGFASLDDATCSILQRRARFTPATNAAGEPIESRVVTPPVKWQLEG